MAEDEEKDEKVMRLMMCEVICALALAAAIICFICKCRKSNGYSNEYRKFVCKAYRIKDSDGKKKDVIDALEKITRKDEFDAAVKKYEKVVLNGK